MRYRARGYVSTRLVGLKKHRDCLACPHSAATRVLRKKGVEPSTFRARCTRPHRVLTAYAEECEPFLLLFWGLDGRPRKVNDATVSLQQLAQEGRIGLGQDNMSSRRPPIVLDDRVMARLNRERLAATHPQTE
jgi:hypothetical protein